MATTYTIKIKTVSAYCSYDVEYVRKLFDNFIKEYEDPKTGLKFESTEIEIHRK